MTDIKKIQEAVLDMMDKVSFDEATHTYTRKSDGKWLAGVSTVSDILPKPYLKAWAAKEAVKFLGFTDHEDFAKAKEIQNKIANATLEEYVALLKEAKDAHRRKSTEALETGTDGHAWLESYVKASIRKQALPALPDGLLRRPLEQFVAWAEKNVEQWILSEARVADVEEEYAGCLDAAAVMKLGILAIVDFKLANQISYDYHLQTSGYVAPFEKYGVSFDQRIIVRLPKTLTKEVYDRKTRKYNTVPNDLEVRIVDTDYEFDKQTFLAARRIQKWINHLPKED